MHVVDDVAGVAFLGFLLFVVFEKSCRILLYNIDTLDILDVVINVIGLKDPHDIVVCRHNRQLYVVDCDCSIWRVSADDHSYVRWLPPSESTTDTQSVYALSMWSRRLLLTSSEPPVVRQYSTKINKIEVLCDVQLPQYMKSLSHAVETTRGTFVVCHRGTKHDEWQYAVSELCEIDVCVNNVL